MDVAKIVFLCPPLCPCARACVRASVRACERACVRSSSVCLCLSTPPAPLPPAVFFPKTPFCLGLSELKGNLQTCRDWMLGGVWSRSPHSAKGNIFQKWRVRARNNVGISQRKTKGGGKLRGGGETYHKSPPQKRFWTPPLMIRFPPPPLFTQCHSP